MKEENRHKIRKLASMLADLAIRQANGDMKKIDRLLSRLKHERLKHRRRRGGDNPTPPSSIGKEGNKGVSKTSAASAESNPNEPS
jgi:hypothetical protein